MKKNTSIWALAIMGMVTFLGCGNKGSAEEKTSTQTAVNESLSTEQVPFVRTTAADAFVVKGIVNDMPGALVVLSELSTQNITLLDSVRANDKGEFELKADAPSIKIGFITVNQTQPPGVPLVMKNGEKLKLELEMSQFIVTKVKGNEDNMAMKRLYDRYTENNKASVEFQNKVQNIDPRTLSDSVREAYNKEYTLIEEGMTNSLWDFIKEEKGSPATYFAATYVMQKPPVAMMDDALTKMKETMSESDLTSELENRLNQIKPLSIGSMAPDIQLNNPQGEMVALSSLQGKVVLIDFWASWCRPCRMENPNVKRVYEKYKDKGFEIYGVSLDNNKGRWEGAIAQDGLTWHHVSDLKGWKSSAAQLYKVSSIPKTVLLDEKGRIIAMDLRGSSLEAKLAELFE